MIHLNQLRLSSVARRVTVEVLEITDGGIEVKVGDSDVSAFIKRADLSRDRGEQRPERFQVGETLDAAVLQLDKSGRKMNLSIKALEIAEEKEAVAQYGSTDSGASLGDILGAALGSSKSDDEEEGEAEKSAE